LTEIYEVFKTPLSLERHNIKVDMSMGVSIFPDDSNDINQLIMNTDLALYNVKNSGKNSFSYFTSDLSDHLKYRQEIKSYLSDAFRNDSIRLVYHPQVDLSTGEIIGFEALARLNNCDISPREFIPIAEDEGLIMQFGRIITRIAIEQMFKWENMGLELKPISINFSANYKDYLLVLLKKYNISPNLIVIEITENILLENMEQAITFLNELKNIGVKIAIDDFGTGYSSLSYLTSLPLDIVKIDKVLNAKFLEPHNVHIMEKLISLFHSFDYNVIAEGIEIKEHVDIMKLIGCDAIQGYYFSKPIEAGDILENYNKNYYA